MHCKRLSFLKSGNLLSRAAYGNFLPQFAVSHREPTAKCRRFAPRAVTVRACKCAHSSLFGTHNGCPLCYEMPRSSSRTLGGQVHTASFLAGRRCASPPTSLTSVFYKGSRKRLRSKILREEERQRSALASRRRRLTQSAVCRDEGTGVPESHHHQHSPLVGPEACKRVAKSINFAWK